MKIKCIDCGCYPEGCIVSRSSSDCLNCLLDGKYKPRQERREWACCSDSYSFQEPDTHRSSKWTISTGQHISYRSERTVKRNANYGSD